MPETTNRPAFTIRFEDRSTHECLRVVARERGVSMNRLAEEFIERELRTAALGLELELSKTLEALREYRSETADADWSLFGEAEVDVDDPVETRQLDIPMSADPLGVADIFG